MRPGSAMYTQAVVQVFVPTNAYADPCHSEEPMSPPVGPTVDDLTAVLTNLPGILVTSPVADITIDGYSGKTFDLESTLIAERMSRRGPVGADVDVRRERDKSRSRVPATTSTSASPSSMSTGPGAHRDLDVR